MGVVVCRNDVSMLQGLFDQVGWCATVKGMAGVGMA